MAILGPCSSCNFWTNNTSMKRWECHRYPPVIPATGTLSIWPGTRGADVCGEWALAVSRLAYISDWTFNAAAYVPPPASGRFRFNSSAQNQATNIIYISVLDQNGVDKTVQLAAALKAGANIHFEDKADPAKYKDYVLMADETLVAGSPAYMQCSVAYLGGGPIDIGSNLMKVMIG